MPIFSSFPRIQYNNVKRQLAYEKVPDPFEIGKTKSFTELNEKEQMVLVKARLKSYSNSVYRKTKVTEGGIFQCSSADLFSFLLLSCCVFLPPPLLRVK